MERYLGFLLQDIDHQDSTRRQTNSLNALGSQTTLSSSTQYCILAKSKRISKAERFTVMRRCIDNKGCAPIANHTHQPLGRVGCNTLPQTSSACKRLQCQGDI